MEKEICIVLGLDPIKLVNPRSIKNKFNYNQLVFAILSTASIEAAGTSLGFSRRYFLKLLQESDIYQVVSTRFGEPTGNRTWKSILLRSVNKKACCGCSLVLDRTFFYEAQSNFDGLQTRCKTCSALEASKRKRQLEIRTPKWANIKDIALFYANCPYGYEVDHVIPLNGASVCGLHTIENLQYLPAKENRRKGNKLLE